MPKPFVLALTMLALCLGSIGHAGAQLTIPTAPKVTGAQVFQQQCATCHTLDAKDPPRQGPTLAGVIGRHAGSVPGFHYSAGFAQADFAWDAAHLDAWLTNPQAIIPGAIMPYRQASQAKRATIIEYLSGLK